MNEKDQQLQDEIIKDKKINEEYLEKNYFFISVKHCIRAIKTEAELKGRQEARAEVLDEVKKIILKDHGMGLKLGNLILLIEKLKENVK